MGLNFYGGLRWSWDVLGFLSLKGSNITCTNLILPKRISDFTNSQFWLGYNWKWLTSFLVMIGYPKFWSHNHYIIQIAIQIPNQNIKNSTKIPHHQQSSTFGAEAHAAVPLRHAIGQRQQRRAVGRQQIQRRRRCAAVAQLGPAGAGRHAQ